jgi:hypothetical protein
MIVPPNQTVAWKKRLKEWKGWLKNFQVNYQQSSSSNKVAFSYIPQAAWLLNDMYWRLAEQYLRQVLNKDDEKEHKLHPYKIISASEIAVMMVEPITLKGDEKAERELNASLAWFVATQILEGWVTGSPVIVASEHIDKVAYCQEHIDTGTKYPTSFAIEHVKWLAELNVTIEKPLLLNAQCWRLFYIACMAVASNGKLVEP